MTPLDDDPRRLAQFLKVEKRLSAWLTLTLQLFGLVTLLSTLTALSQRPEVVIHSVDPVACVDLKELRLGYEAQRDILGPPPESIVNASLDLERPAAGPNTCIEQTFQAGKWEFVRVPDRQVVCWFDPPRGKDRELAATKAYSDSEAHRTIPTTSTAQAEAARKAWATPSARPEEVPVNAMAALHEAARHAARPSSTVTPSLKTILGPFSDSVEVTAAAADPFPPFVAKSGETGYRERWAWDLLQGARWTINQIRLSNSSDEFAEVGVTLDRTDRGTIEFLGGDLIPTPHAARYAVTGVKLFPHEERWMVFRTKQGPITSAEIVVHHDPTLRPSRNMILMAVLAVVIVLVLVAAANFWPRTPPNAVPPASSPEVVDSSQPSAGPATSAPDNRG